MGKLFGSIYCWFEDFFGIELADYMWGQAAKDVTTNQFIGIGFTMLGISLAMVLVFYYAVNHPRLNNWWGWLIFLGANSVINFIVGWQWVLSDFYAGKMKAIDPATNFEVSLNIGESACLCFGASNMILSILSFILFSFIFKWWSSNVSNAPI